MKSSSFYDELRRHVIPLYTVAVLSLSSGCAHTYTGKSYVPYDMPTKTEIKLAKGDDILDYVSPEIKNLGRGIKNNLDYTVENILPGRPEIRKIKGSKKSSPGLVWTIEWDKFYRWFTGR